MRGSLIRSRKWLVANVAVITSIALPALGIALLAIGVSRWLG